MTESVWWTAWKALGIFVRSWVPQRAVLWRWPPSRVVASILVLADIHRSPTTWRTATPTLTKR